ncbi:MAG: hypothetical protein AAF645_16955, partial [Myxococcota bacterium]
MGVRPEACEAYLAAGSRGEAGELERAALALEREGGALGQGWALVFRGALAELTASPPPSVAVLAESRADRSLIERACTYGERWCFAAFDREGLAAYRAARPG